MKAAVGMWIEEAFPNEVAVPSGGLALPRWEQWATLPL